MKNIIKKVIPVFALALVAFLGAKTIDAATVEFVPYSGFPTVGMVSNYSDCEGCATWSSSVSADPGETITVSVYVKNVGTSAASGTKVSMTPSYADSTSHNIGVKITSGTITESGNVTVNVTGGEGQTLTYHDGSATVLYYPCLDGVACGVDTTSGTLFGSGVSIGTVPAAGTHYYAYVQAKFDVSEDVVDDASECDDDIDNDGDGHIDFGDDPGCSSYSDDDEFNDTGSDEWINVTTESASDENEDSATLNGFVDVGDEDNVSLYFEWGEDDAIADLDNTENADDSETDSNTDFEVTIDGLDSDTEYFFRACAEDESGDVDCGSIKSFSTEGGSNGDFDVSTDNATDEDEDSATLNGSVDPGGLRIVKRRIEYGTDDNVSDLDDTKDADCDLNDGDSEDFDATITGLNDNTEYFFRACAEDDDGDEQCGSIESFETDNEDNFVPEVDFNTPFVVTTVVTNVTGSSAKLNGLLTNDGNSSTTGYFEWGSTNSLGLTTTDQSLGLGDGIAFGNFIVGLQPTTIYYYRACARNLGGTVCGDTLSFRTVSTVIPGPTVVPGPTVISVGSGGGGNSRIMLEITSPYDNSCPSDINDYTVKYKNISGRTLTDVILRVTLPSDVTFRRASQGDFTESDNTLTVELNELSVNEEGEVFISGDVTYGVSDEDIIVATAVMAYTYQTTLGQEDAIAYKIHDVTRCGNSLGAFALFGADFLPNSFLGWIILIIAILLLILVTRRLAERRTVTHTTTTSRSINDLPH